METLEGETEIAYVWERVHLKRRGRNRALLNTHCYTVSVLYFIA